ncbi:hypothetical protein BASA81_005811 [Batrachochytrium salamandrivorans]|nr:hypothetical protein BASA81_005811 [Batrachochytrium salamandrivorans]
MLSLLPKRFFLSRAQSRAGRIIEMTSKVVERDPDRLQVGLFRRPALGMNWNEQFIDKLLADRRHMRSVTGKETDFETEVRSWARWANEYEQNRFGKKSGEDRPPKVFVKTVDPEGWAHGRGGRKTAKARVSIRPGEGLSMLVKRSAPHAEYREMNEYFTPIRLHWALGPLEHLTLLGKFDVQCTVHGGGVMGQAGAIRMALAKALQAFEPKLRKELKVNGFLRRDPRAVERKKPGQPKARKKFQWVKR